MLEKKDVLKTLEFLSPPDITRSPVLLFLSYLKVRDGQVPSQSQYSQFRSAIKYLYSWKHDNSVHMPKVLADKLTQMFKDVKRKVAQAKKNGESKDGQGKLPFEFSTLRYMSRELYISSAKDAPFLLGYLL